ncbi:uncharacterized protein LOC144107114 [Amblyomma americanum]
MALNFTNSNLHLSVAQAEKMQTFRDQLGYHVYFTGDGIKNNPFEFNLSQSIYVSTPTAVAAISLVGKNVEFSVALTHFSQEERLSYTQTYQGQVRTATAILSSSDGVQKQRDATDYVVTEGVHIVRAAIIKGLINFYVDDQPLIKTGERPFGTLKTLVISGTGLTVYEVHFVVPKLRIAVFTGNGMEVPETPTLYPSSYVEFSGLPFEEKRSWIRIRMKLSEESPKTELYFRKQTGPADEKIVVVVKFYEQHISVWSSEGVQSVAPTELRAPRCIAIYEFILDSLLMCLPSS